MNIGFLSPADPLDKKSWSGTYYSLYKSVLDRGYNIISLSPPVYSKNQLRIMKLVNKVHGILFRGKKYNPIHNLPTAFFAANFFSRKLKENKIDLIFAPCASTEFAFLKTDLPIIYLSDTSFNQVRDYYDWWTGLSSFCIRESNYIEKRAIQKSKAIIYSSNWASEYVIDYYKADPAKIHTIGFGPNIDTPKSLDYNKDYSSTITFLFLAVNWFRKGGDIALQVIENLNSKGYNVKLLVCGCIPPVESKLMEVIPFLDKNKAEDNIKLQNLLANSHFLFVPTRADCTPIVFCEAAAYGLPIITTDTGGVTSIVEHCVNGFALPLDASIEDYVRIIQDLLDSPDKIISISKSARYKYENELNWDKFGEKFENLVKSL